MPRLTKKAPKAAKKARMHDEMSKFKKGSLKSSSGQKVKSRKQAIAIGLSESGQSKKEKPGATATARNMEGRKAKSSKQSKPRNVATKTKPKKAAAMRSVRNKGRH